MAGEPSSDWECLLAAERHLQTLVPGSVRFDLSTSRALWNRTGLALESDEVLAQLLDRGEVAAWRELYRLAAGSGDAAARLRRRILHLCQTVPLSSPHLFIAAMRALDEPIEPYPTPPPPADDLA